MFGWLAAQDRLAFGVEVHRRLAIRITAATQEWSAPAHTLKHGFAALGAGMIGGDGRCSSRLPFAGFCVFAFGIAAAAPEWAALAISAHERFAALRAGFAAFDPFERLHLRLGRFEGL